MRRVKSMALCLIICNKQILSDRTMNFQDIIDRHRDFISACAAISLGTFVGMTGAKFLQNVMNNRALENCPSAKIVTVQDPLIGERLFCIIK